MDYYSKRIQNFQREMKCSYSVLVSDDFDSNVFYFTGFKGYGILIIPKNGKVTLIASKLDMSSTMNKGIKLIPLEKSIKEVISKSVPKHKVVGMDTEKVSFSRYKRLKKLFKPSKIIDVSSIILKQREIKDDYEISQIKMACSISSKILNNCIKIMGRLKTEKEVKSYLDSEAKKLGYDLAYDTIVASAANGANPHYSSCTGKLRRGFLVIDFGIKVNGYCSDMTRTLFLGTPNQNEIKEYGKVLNVQEKAIEMLKGNNKISDTDNYVRKTLGKNYIHSLGHGIGVDIHELPIVSINNKNTIKNNECFTVEPGVYYPGKYGIRIEDSLVKLKNKLRILTPVTKKMLIINNKLYK